jgi:hypothetical protein
VSGIVLVVLIFFGLAGVLGGVAYFTYKRKLRRAKAIERGLKMVPILIHLPPPSSDTQGANRDLREVMREKTAQAEVLYNLIAGTATEGFKSKFYGQRHVALELITTGGVVHFYAAVPVALVSTVQKAIQTAYPGARMEEVEDHNIFNQEGRLAATLGGEMVLREESAYPIATYAKLERDPMEALLTTISALEKQDGAAIQIMLRPANPNWTKRSVAVANAKRKGYTHDLSFTAMDLAKAAVKSPEQRREEERMRTGGVSEVSNLELSEVEAIEEKTKHPGFEVLVRVIVSTGSVPRSQQLLRDIATAFALFEAPGVNGFKFLPALDVQGLVTAFIFRFFPPELRGNVLNSVELATLFHLPDSQFTPSTSVERQQSKQVDGPVQLPTVGLLFGFNDFRGVKKEIRLSPEDRRRHTYILGQTGTGKSTMLENLAVQDMLAGNGFAFIDPHGDSAEKLLAMVPKERAEDVIYFNPADTQYPLGLNLFEFSDPSQKDFIVQETINMLYKLYDPGHTGIIGPRYEHWYRNAALTLMSDPNGATFIEIPKVFTDTDYLKQKFKYLRDPTVIDFWTKEMGQTSDYHKSEMLGWFVSKFGAFQNNEMMRNIIGQTKSSFNLREVMDKKKILIVNLSKGRVGELNSQLLGMIFVIKFQAAAMSRADVPEDQRPDFGLYVDEFQNFSTDSFASILSEARKYRLNLIVANQFIGQLSNEIRDAVFGNIGTIVAHRMGPEDAEFMVKQFAPVFDASDLVNIPNFNAAMRLMIGGLPSQPFTVRDSAPLGVANLELGMAIKQLSAAKYGHAQAQVEAGIMDRLNGGKAGGAAPAMPAPAAVGAAPVTPAAAPAPVPAAVAVASVPVPPPVSPPVAAPVSVLQGMAAAPPPIGAPPVGVVPAAPAPVLAPALAPVRTPVAPAVVNTAGEPMVAPSSIIPEDNIEAEADRMAQAGEFNQPGMPLPTPAAPVALPPEPEPATPAMALPTPAAPAAGVMAPPPIGAPPVELPVDSAPAPEPPAPVAAKAPASSDPGTLSLHDITGGKPPAPRAIDPASVPIMTPGTEPPASVVEAAPAVVARPSAPLGTGQPLTDDPYANIDVLGDLTPPPGSEAPAASIPEPVVPAVSVPVGSGQPLADDPYANIDVLGAPERPFVANAEPLAEPAPVVESAPEPEPVQVPPVEAPVVAAAVPVEPAPAPMPEPEIAQVPMPAIAPIQEEAPVVQEAALAEPAPMPESPAPVEEPLAPVPEPEPTPAEPMIHFTDPSARAVLERPYAQDVVTPESNGEPSLNGLPEGVQILPPSAPAPVVAALAPAPALEPTSAPVVVPTAPIPEPAPNPSLLGASPLSNMATTPPPIGAPPMAAPPVATAPEPPAAPAPTPAEPVEAEIAKAAAAAPVPDMNAPLVAALQQASVPPAPSVPEAAATEPAVEQLESVADMLEEKHDEEAEIQAEPKPAPEPETEPKVEAAPELAPESKPQPQPESKPQVKLHPAPEPAPEPALPPAGQIEKAEHEIDDLLSVSLIHPDASATHRRLPEPVELAGPEDETGVDLELNAERSAEQHSKKAQSEHAIEHHGLKVIQPLEPIVPPKEEFAKELAAMNHTAPKPETPKPAPLPVPTEPAALAAAVPSPEPVPAPAPQAVEEDEGLPQAESLAADDVAKARAEQQATQPPAPQAEPEAAPAPEEVPAPANEGRSGNKRRRHRGGRGGRDKSGEHVASEAEAEHNKPTEAETEAGTMTGKLILPTTQKPEPESAQPKTEKPKKLAPGEVYVDDSGNVMIGE